MKLHSRLGALAVTALTLTACTDGSDSGTDAASTPPATETGTLTVWLMKASQPQSVIDAVDAQFSEQYPNVEVDVELKPWAGIQDELASTLDTDSAPDVVEIGNTLTAKYASAGLLADLTAYAADLEVDGMLPGAQPSGELDGVRYGIPYYGGVRVVVYNKGHFSAAGVEVPTSLEELSAAAEKLQEAKAGNATYSAFHFPGKSWASAVPFVWDAGGELAKLDGDTWTGTLDSAESRAGLTTLKSLVDAYSKAPVDADESGNVEAFRAGDVGMMIDSWWVPGALDSGALKGEVGAFPLPGSGAGSTAPVIFFGSDLAVPAKSERQALAVRWMEILTGVEVQTKLAAAGVIPNQEGAFAGHQGNPYLAAAGQAATNSRFTPVSPNWVNVEVSQVLPDMLVEIFSDSSTIEEATAEASSKITGIMNS
jgi:N,N'-diacetylchitobiose transport system substrate-binding protein